MNSKAQSRLKITLLLTICLAILWLGLHLIAESKYTSVRSLWFNYLDSSRQWQKGSDNSFLVMDLEKLDIEQRLRDIQYDKQTDRIQLLAERIRLNKRLDAIREDYPVWVPGYFNLEGKIEYTQSKKVDLGLILPSNWTPYRDLIYASESATGKKKLAEVANGLHDLKTFRDYEKGAIIGTIFCFALLNVFLLLFIARKSIQLSSRTVDAVYKEHAKRSAKAASSISSMNQPPLPESEPPNSKQPDQI